MRRVRRVIKRKIKKTAGDASLANTAMPPGEDGLKPGSTARVVIVGQRVFNLRLARLVADETDFNVVATAVSIMEARAAPNEHKADLVVVDVDFGGPAAGIAIARDLNQRRPGCAFMIVCGPFTIRVAKALWVYGADSWSVITQATAKSPAHFAEAVSSAVHGITWVEPGVKRDLNVYGPRPNSFAERRLAMLEQSQSDLNAA